MSSSVAWVARPSPVLLDQKELGLTEQPPLWRFSVLGPIRAWTGPEIVRSRQSLVARSPVSRVGGMSVSDAMVLIFNSDHDR
jgi:hypothetical protein